MALELAQIFARFGTRITLLQRSERILPDHEPEIAEGLADYLRKEGVEIHTGATVLRLGQEGAEKVVGARVGGEVRVFRAAHILVAMGRQANTEGLGLEAAGVETDGRGFVRVNGALRTTTPRIYAAGDATGPPMLVYLAAAEGKRAAENALLGQAEPGDQPPHRAGSPGQHLRQTGYRQLHRGDHRGPPPRLDRDRVTPQKRRFPG